MAINLTLLSDSLDTSSTNAVAAAKAIDLETSGDQSIKLTLHSSRILGQSRQSHGSIVFN